MTGKAACSCGGINAVPHATDHTSDCAIWNEPQDVDDLDAYLDGLERKEREEERRAEQQRLYEQTPKSADKQAASQHRCVIETDSPVVETLDACIEIVERIVQGTVRWTDSTTLLAHLRVLREDIHLTPQEANRG